MFFRQHDPVLLSVGLLEPEYDLPLQISAIGRVRESFPDAGLLMIGSGSLEKDLRSLIAAQPCASHILLAGDVPHSATMQAISRATLMLRTTLYDGDAVSVREALHFGTPVIATDNGMRPPGLHLFPKSDLSALLQVLARELGRERPAAKAPVGVDESNLRDVLDFYRELLGR